MSTVQRVNFEPMSDMITVTRRNFPVVDRTLIDPFNANVYLDGEWMVVTNEQKIQRATDLALDGAKVSYNGNIVPPYLWWNERGRTDVQALGSGTLLYAGWYEGETRIFKATAKQDGNAPEQYPAISYVGQPLQVATITVGTRVLSGLVGAVDATVMIVGFVTRLPATNGGKLRFQSRLTR
jgi:hypothetical protein